MSKTPFRVSSALLSAILVAVAALTSPPARADIDDDAVRHAGRSPEDLKRDVLDHPAEILRLAGKRLPNVEHRTEDLEHPDIAADSLDALLMIKVYHDLYWVDTDPKSVWPRYDAANALDQAARLVKPGGTLVIVDHSAKAGTGSADAGTLHRIDEAYTIKDFEKRGFKLVAKSDVLRRPDDARDQISYKPPALGKTDRFVLIFRKNKA